MTEPNTFWRPELGAFADALLAIGGKPLAPMGDSAADFHLETSLTDEVQISMQMDETDDGQELLTVSLTLYPEDTMQNATPQQVATIIAGWLRDTAAKLEAVAGERA